MALTPLVLIAGFLGVGKTSLLRTLLPLLGARGLRPRVFLNDFQNAELDAATLRDLAPTLVALSGSCLCCQSETALLEGLAAIEGIPGEVILLEANGTTDTAALIDLLTGSPDLDHVAPPLQVTLVDVKRFGTRDWRNQMEAEQVLTATEVVFTWADTVGEERSAEVRSAVAKLNPRAHVTTPQALVDLLVQVEGTLRNLPDRSHLDAGPHAPRVHDASSHFASFQVPLPKVIDPVAFLKFLNELPQSVLRAKGIVNLAAPIGEKRSFQKVGDHAEISPCQLADPDDIEAAAVFIGVGMPSLEIRARLRRV